MKMTDFQEKISALLPKMDIRFNESMAKHTSFRIGGAAEVLIVPKSVSELSEIWKAASSLRTVPIILGAGTNVLVPDGGLPGLVICLKDGLQELYLIDDCTLYAGAGVTMTRAAVFAAGKNLSGLEFAHGIPGTVGGGVYMNAGAYGSEIRDVCSRVDVMDSNGKITAIPSDQMGFSYRHSVLEERGGVVTGAVFSLTPMSQDRIREKMRELMNRRKASQPLDMPSAGSAFKRPAGGYAAALIDEAGLRGYRVGNAAVSEKHTGFVVNLGGATSDDVQKVLKNVSDIVFERTGIRLEPEVRIL